MWLGGRCVLCDRAAVGMCPDCRADLTTPPKVELDPEIDSTLVLFGYEGAGAQIIRHLKFHNRRTALPMLADALARFVPDTLDAIVSVPAHPQRTRRRGYDLPALLAGRMAEELRLPVVAPLVRVDDDSQRTRSRSARIESVRYRIAPTTRTAPGRTLLVDDVVTTGATARACGQALRDAGSSVVNLAVLAATPAQSSLAQPAA